MYDANRKLVGHMDPKDLEDEGSIDEAVYDDNGRQLGFAHENDVEPFGKLDSATERGTAKTAAPAQGQKFAPLPAPPEATPEQIQQAQKLRADTAPTPDNVQKARALLDKAMSANPWAVEVLRRHNAARSRR